MLKPSGRLPLALVLPAKSPHAEMTNMVTSRNWVEVAHKLCVAALHTSRPRHAVEIVALADFPSPNSVGPVVTLLRRGGLASHTGAGEHGHGQDRGPSLVCSVVDGNRRVGPNEQSHMGE